MSVQQVMTFSKTGVTFANANDVHNQLQQDMNNIEVSSKVASKNGVQFEVTFEFDEATSTLKIIRTWFNAADYDQHVVDLPNASEVEDGLRTLGWVIEETITTE